MVHGEAWWCMGVHGGACNACWFMVVHGRWKMVEF